MNFAEHSWPRQFDVVVESPLYLFISAHIFRRIIEKQIGHFDSLLLRFIRYA